MPITLEQARALDALARHGTFSRAAEALRKGHTALVYSIRTLEEQTELVLLDRSGYRTRLTPAGERVLAKCRELLAAEAELEAICHAIRSGWEPQLRVVFDGVYSATPILRGVARITAERAPTRIDVSAEFLSGVEAAFVRTGADVMISVLASTLPALEAIALAPIHAYLVARRDHPLVATKKRVSSRDLGEHLLLAVRGSDPRLALPTAALEQLRSIHLADFATKKEAIASGVGFGWLPDYLVRRELQRGAFRVLNWDKPSEHVFRPFAYRRAERPRGRAEGMLLEELGAKGGGRGRRV